MNKDFIIIMNYYRVIILNVEGTYSQNNKNNKNTRKV